MAAALHVSGGEDRIQWLDTWSVAQTLTVTANRLCSWHLTSQLLRLKSRDALWDGFFSQAVNRCQAAITTQYPGFLTLKSPHFSVIEKEKPQNSAPTHLGMHGEKKKNTKEGEKAKRRRWKEDLRRKKRRLGVWGKAKARRNWTVKGKKSNSKGKEIS